VIKGAFIVEIDSRSIIMKNLKNNIIVKIGLLDPIILLKVKVSA